MSDLKLFRVTDRIVEPVASSTAALEVDLQRIVEANMETIFGVRLLASEYSTGLIHAGRMDSIGIDESGTPVIFEYKRNISESVINQGLFYLDWLIDHQGDFKVLVQERLGHEVAKTVDFAGPRLVCIANGFTRYDEHALRRIGGAIELVRYQQFEGGLLAFDLVASTTANKAAQTKTLSARNPVNEDSNATRPTTPGKYTTVAEHLQKSPRRLQELYDDLRVAIEGLGDDVSINQTKYYFNFRKLKSFASVEVYSQAQKLLVYVKLDPQSMVLEEGFMRDVTNIGHLGNGHLELTITSPETLAKAMPYISASYEAN
ncbi:MAG: DUF5655 domain-containing protein [Marmoricola sp.]